MLATPEHLQNDQLYATAATNNKDVISRYVISVGFYFLVYSVCLLQDFGE